jgi:23S rRNA (adenine2503-C2)-methyltransferase
LTKKNLKDFSFSELDGLVSSIGEPSYRVKQLKEWLYEKRCCSIGDMTNFSKKLRESLSADFTADRLEILDKQVSSDGTVKYLFGLPDSLSIETVYIPSDERGTICLSTQVGCKFGCSFCATGSQGFSRDLSLGEITNQFVTVKNDLAENGGALLTNIVFMGMGEPLDNFENLINAIEIFNSPEGFGISPRRITVSTVGIVPMIEKLGDDGRGVNLAVSLHSADNAVRSKFMPINKKYPVETLVKTLASYPLRPYRQITIEVALFSGINDSTDDALKLARLLKQVKAKVNLIPVNRVAGSRFDPSGMESVLAFQEVLKKEGISATVRKDRGGDIDAACGQLKSKYSD